jgi:[ribosomal protein S5]-alanine N-acetyltransferase
MNAPLHVPILTAGPFRLRPFELKDVDLLREAAQDRYIPLITTVPVPYTEETARDFIERQCSRARTGVGYSFAIAGAGIDRAIGQIGLWLKDIESGRASIGYWIVASGRGHGAAQQAVSAIVRWAFQQLSVPRLELYVEPWNDASIRTAERAGFKREGLLRSWQSIDGSRKDLYMYSILPADLAGRPR